MKKTLQEQANEILERAEARGVSSNFFFVTTFKRYQVQMKMLAELEQSIEEFGPTVTKEYVKGRQNVVANPAIQEARALFRDFCAIVRAENEIAGTEAEVDNLESLRNKFKVIG